MITCFVWVNLEIDADIKISLKINLLDPTKSDKNVQNNNKNLSVKSILIKMKLDINKNRQINRFLKAIYLSIFIYI